MAPLLDTKAPSTGPRRQRMSHHQLGQVGASRSGRAGGRPVRTPDQLESIKAARKAKAADLADRRAMGASFEEAHSVKAAPRPQAATTIGSAEATNDLHGAIATEGSAETNAAPIADPLANETASSHLDTLIDQAGKFLSSEEEVRKTADFGTLVQNLTGFALSVLTDPMLSIIPLPTKVKQWRDAATLFLDRAKTSPEHVSEMVGRGFELAKKTRDHKADPNRTVADRHALQAESKAYFEKMTALKEHLAVAHHTVKQGNEEAIAHARAAQAGVQQAATAGQGAVADPIAGTRPNPVQQPPATQPATAAAQEAPPKKREEPVTKADPPPPPMTAAQRAKANYESTLAALDGMEVQITRRLNDRMHKGLFGRKINQDLRNFGGPLYLTLMSPSDANAKAHTIKLSEAENSMKTTMPGFADVKDDTQVFIGLTFNKQKGGLQSHETRFFPIKLGDIRSLTPDELIKRAESGKVSRFF